MIKWYKIDSKLVKLVEKAKEEMLLTEEEFAEKSWIWRSTYYKLRKNKKASARTIRKLKDFLKENGYEVE